MTVDCRSADNAAGGTAAAAGFGWTGHARGPGSRRAGQLTRDRGRRSVQQGEGAHQATPDDHADDQAEDDEPARPAQLDAIHHARTAARAAVDADCQRSGARRAQEDVRVGCADGDRLGGWFERSLDRAGQGVDGHDVTSLRLGRGDEPPIDGPYRTGTRCTAVVRLDTAN